MGKRMFNTDITETDKFIDMPASAQNLYFHLGMHGDDDGFVSAPKRIMRSVGSCEDDLKILISKGFILPFESGVIVITDWHINNNLRNDRYKPTIHINEKSMLCLDESKRYTIGIPDGNQMDTFGIQCDNQGGADGMRNITEHNTAEHNTAEQSAAEQSEKKETTHTIFHRLVNDYCFSDCLQEKVAEWITYKVERKEPYKEQGLKSLLRQIENKCTTYGEKAVADLIDECMANNWKGIIFDRLSNATTQQIGQRSRTGSGQELLDMINGGYFDE